MAPAQQKVLEQTGEGGICIDDPVSRLDLPPPPIREEWKLNTKTQQLD